MEKKRIIICGAGAIGIFLGAKLNANGHEVILFGRRKLKAVKSAGDKVKINGKEFEIPNHIYHLPKKESYDFVFIASKLYDFDKIVKLINKNKLKANFFAAIQNGLVDCSKYKKYLNNKKLIPIVVFGGFKLEKNNLTDSSTSIGWKIEKSREGNSISQLISSSGVPCKPDKKIESIRAEKMIVNCCLNVLSAIENKSFRQLFSKEKTFNRIIALFNESYSILSKEYSLDNKEKLKKEFISAWKNVNHYSSTYQDLKSGRKSEIDFFNGHLIKLAKRYNLSAEENKRIIRDFKRRKNKKKKK